MMMIVLLIIVGDTKTDAAIICKCVDIAITRANYLSFSSNVVKCDPPTKTDHITIRSANDQNRTNAN